MLAEAISHLEPVMPMLRELGERFTSAGHEIAHHGYLHKCPDRARPDEAFEEIDRGLEALRARLVQVTSRALQVR